jgi:hypothetical protein
MTTEHLRDEMRAGATSFWEVEALASPKPVLGDVPLCFTPGVDLSRPFGSWKTAYHPTAKVLSDVALAKSPQVLAAELPPYVGVFAPGFSVSGYSVACDGTAWTTGGCLWELSAPSQIPWQPAKFELAVSLCDSWCKGYYHFSHEHLPRVALVYDLLESGDATLVLPYAMNSFQKQFFVDILGIKRIFTGSASAAVLLHPSPMRCGNTFSGTLHLFRQIVFRRLGLGNMNVTSATGRKMRLVFAERSKGSRMPSNYQAIKASIERRFAHQVEFATTQGREATEAQVRLFHTADIVLGPHGANLANMMFMRPGTHVVEMASLAKGNMCYYTTAVRVGLVYHLVPHHQGKDARYDLDAEVVERHVAHALAALSEKHHA